MIISVVNLKGGCGKTTSAMYLACAALRAGHSVRVHDADPQSTASFWAEEAEEVAGGLPFDVMPANISSVKRLSRNNDSEVDLIDCPPSGNVTDAALDVADLVVIPVTPSEMDLRKTIDTIETCEGKNKSYGALICKAKKNTLSLKAVLDALEQKGASYFDSVIWEREGVKHTTGKNFGASLFGYEDVWAEVEEILS